MVTLRILSSSFQFIKVDVHTIIIKGDDSPSLGQIRSWREKNKHPCMHGNTLHIFNEIIPDTEYCLQIKFI